MQGGARAGAGRKPGSRAQHTIQAEALKAYIISRVVAEKEAIINALIEKAKGRDVTAIRELLDRSMGRPMATLETGQDGVLPFVLVIKPQTPEAGNS